MTNWRKLFNQKTRDSLLFWLLVIIAISYVFLAVISNNYNLLFITFVVIIFIFTFKMIHKELHLTPHILIGLAIVIILHLLGLYVNIGGVRLYDFYLIENLIKYDNITHFFSTFLVAIAGYNLLKPHLDHKVEYNKFLFCFIIILLAMGLGAINELIEFGLVIFLGRAAEVGNYFNNAIDLLFNFFGAIIAGFFIQPHHQKQTR